MTVAGLLLGKFLCGQPVQFVIDQRQELICRHCIAAACSVQKLSYFVHRQKNADALLPPKVLRAIRGTHKGDLTLASGTLPPTGKTIDVPGCDVYHLEGGKITTFHCYYLPSIMQQQLGLKNMRLS